MRTPGQSFELAQVKVWQEGVIRTVEDSLAAEQRLKIRIDCVPMSVVMRT